MSSAKSIVVAPTSPVYSRALWVAEAIFGVVVLVYSYRWVRYRSKIIASQSGDKATQQLMQLLAHNSIIHLAGYAFYYFILHPIKSGIGHKYGLWIIPASSGTWKQILHTCFCLVVVTPGFIALLSTLVPLNLTTVSKPKVRSWDHLYITLVTKGTNAETVKRSAASMRHLQLLDSRITFIVLTDEGSPVASFELGVKIVVVPKAFSPPIAKYKARALEYFRINQRLTDRDWVLHLDEETAVDSHCVLACIDFMEREPAYEWGQGIILYNTVNYWNNSVLTFSEVVRFRDDLGRFAFQHGHVHVPLWGCHGSFLLTSGRVENAVSWDTDCLAEDFWFANQAWWYYGIGGGFIPSIAREQSNWSYMDLLKQRRRWFCGMLKIGFFGKANAFLWLLSTLESVIFLLAPFGMLDVDRWVYVWLDTYCASLSFTLMFSTFLSDLDAGVRKSEMFWNQLLNVWYSWLAGILQTVALLYAVFRPAKHSDGFQVVKKQ